MLIQDFDFWTVEFAISCIGDLDLQFEYNAIRPYTYAFTDNDRNYLHWGQSLAHPMGSNLRDFSTIIRYKPAKRLFAYLTINLAGQGRDSISIGITSSYGGTISKNVDLRNLGRNGNDNQNMLQGIKVRTSCFDMRLSYSLSHNLFIDVRCLIRNEQSAYTQYESKSVISSMAIRYNIPFRQQNF